MKTIPSSRLFKITFFAVMATVAGWTAAGAANNPLNTIPAESASDKSPGIKLEPCSEGGQSLGSIHDGDFAVFPAFDFDSGVAAVKLHVASTQKGSIEVRLDSATGPLLGTCPFDATGGWQVWTDVTSNVDNSQSGVRDVYLVFHGEAGKSLVNLSQFVFLKSTVLTKENVKLSNRLDVVDDEPQATKAWGMPEAGFTDDFSDSKMGNWTSSGMKVDSGKLVPADANLDFAYTPNVYINKTDTGGEWRTMAEASLAADISIESQDARPGIGFASKDGKQWIYVVLNPADDAIHAFRKLFDGSVTEITFYPKTKEQAGSKAEVPPPQKWHLTVGSSYRLQIDWSPYSDGVITFLYDDHGAKLASFRTVIDLPAARRPLLLCSGGGASFANVKFDPTLDSWEYKWEWHKEPVLGDDACNPAVWKGKDGKMYMVWRRFGKDTFHGVASSDDGIKWTRVNDEAMKTTGDMNVLVDPLGDGLVYITPGGGGLPWWTCDGSNNYSDWKLTNLTVGDIFGNSRIQELIDTKKYPQMHPISFNGTSYRFMSYVEDWNRMPKPHSVVLLSNTLTEWVQASPNPVIPPGDQFWGEKGNAIGSALPLPDGNILIADCACTFAGYTGAPEPSNVSAIADGKEPWKILKLGTLPDAPVSRENVWYQGPNFGTALYYDPDTDTLFFYGGFHDYRVGMMRVQHFLKSQGMQAAAPAAN